MKLLRKDGLRYRELSEDLIELPCSGCSHLPCAYTQSTAEAKHLNFSVSLRLVMGWEYANCENMVQLTCSAGFSTNKTRCIQMSPCELGASPIIDLLHTASGTQTVSPKEVSLLDRKVLLRFHWVHQISTDYDMSSALKYGDTYIYFSQSMREVLSIVTHLNCRT